jgi:hypothetical protein
MDGKFEEKFKTIRALLIVLIVTTAATAGIVAVVMIQWEPVATYYKEMIAEEAAYEAEYGDEDLYIDESGEALDEGTLVDEEGNPVDGDVVITDEEDSSSDGDVVITDEEDNAGEDVTIPEEEGTTDAAVSEDAAQ